MHLERVLSSLALGTRRLESVSTLAVGARRRKRDSGLLSQAVASDDRVRPVRAVEGLGMTQVYRGSGRSRHGGLRARSDDGMVHRVADWVEIVRLPARRLVGRRLWKEREARRGIEVAVSGPLRAHNGFADSSFSIPAERNGYFDPSSAHLASRSHSTLVTAAAVALDSYLGRTVRSEQTPGRSSRRRKRDWVLPSEAVSRRRRHDADSPCPYLPLIVSIIGKRRPSSSRFRAL